MRIIDSNHLENTTSAQTGRSGDTSSVTSAGKNGSSAAGKTGGSADRVELSGFSGRVSQTLQTDASSRAQRVAQLSALVRSGKYQVDSKAVSKAIVDQAISGRGTE